MADDDSQISENVTWTADAGGHSVGGEVHDTDGRSVVDSLSPDGLSPDGGIVQRRAAASASLDSPARRLLWDLVVTPSPSGEEATPRQCWPRS